MREIKFRAWDKVNDVMRYDFMLSNNGDYYVKYDDEVRMICEGAIEIMQYTGVKDMHGKEVYEGDIFKWDSYYYGDHKIKSEMGSVCFYDGMFYIKNAHGDYNFAPDLDHCDVCNYNLEVIGNIYENPELLDKQ